MKQFTSKARSKDGEALKTTIPIEVVRKHEIGESDRIKILIRGVEAEVKTRRVKSKGDYLEIGLPAKKYRDKISAGDIIEVKFEQLDGENK